MFLTSDWGKFISPSTVNNGVIRIYNIDPNINVDDLELHLLKHFRSYGVLSVIPPSPWSNLTNSCYKLIIEGNAKEFVNKHKFVPEMPDAFMAQGIPQDLESHFPKPFLNFSGYPRFETRQNDRPPGWYNGVPFIDVPKDLKKKYCVNVSGKPIHWSSTELKEEVERCFEEKGIYLNIYCTHTNQAYPSSGVIVASTLKTREILLDYNPLYINNRVTLNFKPL